ncbi:MAG: winged helix-turn-helix transcriptional regulator, partial [Rhizobiales bacterium]|nr:winged helix-turn-helix transcriptional regulator [Hyphomicrobiales bacterium]
MKLDNSRPIIGSNAERTKDHNRKAVLGLVKHHQPVGRAELARLSGLSTQAVSNIISELESTGYLVEAGRKIVGRGLPSIQYTLKRDGGYGLGIEIRPNAMFVALTNLAGEPCYSKRVSISDCSPKNASKIAAQLMDDALAHTGIKHDQLLGAGVVLPGPFGDVGLSGVGDTTLTGWDDTNPKKLFAEALNLPIIVEN